MMLIVASIANAQPMSYATMRSHARFLTDRMVYTLGLRPYLIDDLYMINYDYVCGVNDYLADMAYGYTYAEYEDILYQRDRALRRLLNAAQWAHYISYDYFYRPIVFANNTWRFRIYAHDLRHKHYYYSRPRHYRNYQGGHYFGPMQPAHRPRITHHAPARPGRNADVGRRNDRHDDRQYGGQHREQYREQYNGRNGRQNDGHANTPDYGRQQRDNHRGNTTGQRENTNKRRDNQNRNGNVSGRQSRGDGNPQLIRTSTRSSSSSSRQENGRPQAGRR